MAAALIRVVRDVVVVAGATPRVWRVLAAKTGSVTGFEMEPVEGEVFEGPGKWPPELFTQPMLIHSTGLLVPADRLKPVDILHIWSGSNRFGNQDESYWLWQQASTTPLGRLTLMETRDALRSPWIQSQRAGRSGGTRGIIFREGM